LCRFLEELTICIKPNIQGMENKKKQQKKILDGQQDNPETDFA
jgi:hypothetical protein